MFAGSSCYAVVTYGSMIASGHFDKKIRFWDRRQDQPANEITLMGKITSMELANGQCRFKVVLSCVPKNIPRKLPSSISLATCLRLVHKINY